MTDPAPGTLLIAEPPMADPNFKRSVILLCEHDEEQGSFGLVLNRPAEFRLAEVANRPLPFDAPLAFGGPVQLDTLHYVHPYGDVVEGALPLVDDVFWGGQFESLLEGMEKGWLNADRFRFFVGYSGWGPGQLRAELDEKSWIVVPASAEIVFAESDDALWRALLRRMGGELALLSTFPDDPRLN
ncbi:MAG TPA: YqgE/AlgH family protein [Rubricoccaceae bacterium]|nr:YqgE/AlgH family protein [Rubricoccaceae bacterium]